VYVNNVVLCNGNIDMFNKILDKLLNLMMFRRFSDGYIILTPVLATPDTREMVPRLPL
jgi:hypothetical protein